MTGSPAPFGQATEVVWQCDGDAPSTAVQGLHRATQHDLIWHAAQDAETTLDLVREGGATTVVADAWRPQENGILRRLSAGEASVLVVIEQGDCELVAEALRRGACGVMLADTSVVEAVTAARYVTAGQLFCSSSILEGMQSVLAAALAADPVGHTPERLTGRELEVLRMLAVGSTNDEIARDLVVSVATVRSHVLSVLRKLGVRNRAQAVAVAYGAAVLPPAPAVHPAPPDAGR